MTYHPVGRSFISDWFVNSFVMVVYYRPRLCFQSVHHCLGGGGTLPGLDGGDTQARSGQMVPQPGMDRGG